MDYTLKNKSDLEGTCWIEFNISGTVDSYEHWADNSKYLEEFAYNFYTDIFEERADNFNYYGDTKFDKEQLARIKLMIDNRIKTLDNLHTLQDIIEFSKKISHTLNLGHDIDATYNKLNGQHNKLVSDIKNLGHELSNLLAYCIKQDKTLWVLGL